MERIKEAHPEAQFSVNMIKAIKEKFSNVAADMPPVIVQLPVKGKPTDFDITDIMRDACNSIVAPLVDGLGELVASFDPEFQDRLKNRVLLAGGGSQIRGLDIAVEKYMQEAPRWWQGHQDRRSHVRRLERRSQDRPRHARRLLGAAQVELLVSRSAGSN